MFNVAALTNSQVSLINTQTQTVTEFWSNTCLLFNRDKFVTAQAGEISFHDFRNKNFKVTCQTSIYFEVVKSAKNNQIFAVVKPNHGTKNQIFCIQLSEGQWTATIFGLVNRRDDSFSERSLVIGDYFVTARHDLNRNNYFGLNKQAPDALVVYRLPGNESEIESIVNLELGQFCYKNGFLRFDKARSILLSLRGELLELFNFIISAGTLTTRETLKVTKFTSIPLNKIGVLLGDRWVNFKLARGFGYDLMVANYTGVYWVDTYNQRAKWTPTDGQEVLAKYEQHHSLLRVVIRTKLTMTHSLIGIFQWNADKEQFEFWKELPELTQYVSRTVVVEKTKNRNSGMLGYQLNKLQHSKALTDIYIH